MDFFAGRISIEDVCRQYDDEGVDVIVDGPGNYFWKEMAEYWPKAKIILTVRDNEDKVNIACNYFFYYFCYLVVLKSRTILHRKYQMAW